MKNGIESRMRLSQCRKESQVVVLRVK